MAYLTDCSFNQIQKEVEEMTQEEAKKVWEKVENNWTYVALRAGNGSSKAKLEWLLLLRKMGILERKAKGENPQ